MFTSLIKRCFTCYGAVSPSETTDKDTAGGKQPRQFFQPDYSNYSPLHAGYPQWPSSPSSFPSFPSFPHFPGAASFTGQMQQQQQQQQQQQWPDMGWLENPLFTSWLQGVASSAQLGGSSPPVPSFPSMPNFPSRPQITIIVINPPATASTSTEKPIVSETSTQVTDSPTTTTTTTEVPIKYSVTIAAIPIVSYRMKNLFFCFANRFQ